MLSYFPKVYVALCVYFIYSMDKKPKEFLVFLCFFPDKVSLLFFRTLPF